MSSRAGVVNLKDGETNSWWEYFVDFVLETDVSEVLDEHNELRKTKFP